MVVRTVWNCRDRAIGDAIVLFEERAIVLAVDHESIRQANEERRQRADIHADGPEAGLTRVQDLVEFDHDPCPQRAGDES